MKNIVSRNIIACHISDIILGTFFQLPIWIVYQSRFLSFSQIALYSGLSLLTEVIMQIPTGAIADIFGRRLSLSLGNLFMALPMFLIAFYPHPEIMFLYSLMWGLGRAFAMGTSKPILYETLVESGEKSLYPRILSRSVVAFQLSAAISIASGGYLYQISPNLPYIFSGVASLIGIFTAYLFVEPTRPAFSHTRFVNTIKNGWHEIFKNSFMVKLTALYALALGLAQSSQQFFMQPYMVELGLNDIQRSWVAMFIKISIALIGAKIVTHQKIFSHRYFMIFIPLLMVISMLPASFVTLPFAYLLFFGIAFSSGNTDLFLSPEINSHLDSSVRSTSISLQRMLASIISALAQWASVGTITQTGVGTYYSYLGLFSLIIIVPLAINLSVHKHRKYQPFLPV